jgi:hypothetical protein
MTEGGVDLCGPIIILFRCNEKNLFLELAGAMCFSDFILVLPDLSSPLFSGLSLASRNLIFFIRVLDFAFVATIHFLLRTACPVNLDFLSAGSVL